MFGSIDTPTGRVGFHLSTVKPPRRVPAGERHAWTGIAKRPGDTATCIRCGCVKAVGRDYSTTFRMPGSGSSTSLRPPCPGPPPAPDGQ